MNKKITQLNDTTYKTIPKDDPKEITDKYSVVDNTSNKLIWSPPDHYFVSDNISVNNFWINKYNDQIYNQVVSRISLGLNNSDKSLNKELVTIAYPKNQTFLGLKIIPENPSEDEILLKNLGYIPKKQNIINKTEKKDKTKIEKDAETKTKIDSLSIGSEDKNKLKVGNVDGYEFKTFEVDFQDDEDYLIQAHISSNYGLNEKLYIYIEGSFAGGSGTSEDPYQIETWAQLQEVNDYPSSSFILENNLDSDSTGYDTYASSTANSGAGWFPIGNNNPRFEGTFDGQGYTISDLYIDRGVAAGLFGVTDTGTTISNIGVVNCDITNSYQYTGGLVGRVMGAGTFTNSYSTGTVDSSSHYVGGLIGYSIGTVTNSYSTASVNGNLRVGGLVGQQQYGTVTNSYSIGSVSGVDDAGGLIGYNYNATYNNDFWDTQTSGQATSAGGTGATTAQMKDFDTFDPEWDIVLIGDWVDETWYIDDGNDYPRLGWEYTPATTDIKSYNGLAKASIKSINGLAIASVKSINGLE